MEAWEIQDDSAESQDDSAPSASMSYVCVQSASPMTNGYTTKKLQVPGRKETNPARACTEATAWGMKISS